MRCRFIFILVIMVLILQFAGAQQEQIEEVIQEENFLPEEFVEEEPFFEEELTEEDFPPEMSIEESEHPVSEPYIEKDTDNKGIYYEIHYDKYERAVRVEDHFIRDYKGVVEYEYFSELQRREHDGQYGYEWVVSREESTFYKGDEVIAVRNFDFDKQGNVIDEEKEGTTLVIAIMRFLSNFYGVDPPK